MNFNNTNNMNYTMGNAHPNYMGNSTQPRPQTQGHFDIPAGQANLHQSLDDFLGQVGTFQAPLQGHMNFGNQQPGKFNLPYKHGAFPIKTVPLAPPINGGMPLAPLHGPQMTMGVQPLGFPGAGILAQNGLSSGHQAIHNPQMNPMAPSVGAAGMPHSLAAAPNRGYMMPNLPYQHQVGQMTPQMCQHLRSEGGKIAIARLHHELHGELMRFGSILGAKIQVPKDMNLQEFADAVRPRLERLVMGPSKYPSLPPQTGDRATSNSSSGVKRKVSPTADEQSRIKRQAILDADNVVKAHTQHIVAPLGLGTPTSQTNDHNVIIVATSSATTSGTSSDPVVLDDEDKRSKPLPVSSLEDTQPKEVSAKSKTADEEVTAEEPTREETEDERRQRKRRKHLQKDHELPLSAINDFEKPHLSSIYSRVRSLAEEGNFEDHLWLLEDSADVRALVCAEYNESYCRQHNISPNQITLSKEDRKAEKRKRQRDARNGINRASFKWNDNPDITHMVSSAEPPKACQAQVELTKSEAVEETQVDDLEQELLDAYAEDAEEEQLEEEKGGSEPEGEPLAFNASLFEDVSEFGDSGAE